MWEDMKLAKDTDLHVSNHAQSRIRAFSDIIRIHVMRLQLEVVRILFEWNEGDRAAGALDEIQERTDALEQRAKTEKAQ
jgi:hypothetical protein